MADSGIVPDSIKRFESPNTDCASLPISLNLEGVKSDKPIRKKVGLKIAAVMSVPRYGSLAAMGLIQHALWHFNIPLNTTSGVFWGQCMQRMFEEVVDVVDVILTVDYDTVIARSHLEQMWDCLARYPEADAVAALQPRRGKDKPLFTRGGDTHCDTDGTPILVTTAHFGLTAIRTDALKKVEKPWFYGQHEPGGTWGDDKLDDDIWFWHQWRKAGNTIYVDPLNRIGHLGEMVGYYDDMAQVQYCPVPEWREKFLGGRENASG